MKRKRYTEEQIISILKEHEAGASVPELSRRHGVAENTIYRWKSKFGGMEISEAKRLRELEAGEREAEAAAGRGGARQGRTQGAGRGKMVTAAQRRRAVDHLKSRRVSERRACRLTGFSRSAAWYPLKGRDDAALRARLRALAERYPRYGYPTLHDMLRTEGLVQNPKRTYRIYREEGLQVRTKRRKKLNRPRIPMVVPNQVNERWSMDFVSDQLANGRRIPGAERRGRLHPRVRAAGSRLLDLRPAPGP